MSYHPEEFIGSQIRVSKSRNKDLEGIKGKIVDETKETFIIITNDQTKKTLLKEGTVFIINNKEIIGDQITKKPEERIKQR